MLLKSMIVLSLLTGLNAVLAQPKTAQTAYPFWSNDTQPKLMTGDCRVCPLLPQSKWYFTGEWLAISDEKLKPDAIGALPDWLEGAPFIEYPPPVWLGKPQVIENIKFNSQYLRWPNGQVQPWRIIDKIAQNKSYWNTDTADFFAGKKLRMRGETIKNQFIAETIWPLDFNIQSQIPEPLTNAESIQDWLRADQGGVNRPHSDRLIWQRNENSAVSAVGKPVLAMLLNGAQGDDHEALGGHFALVTGMFNKEGHYHNWLVNNFYSLDVVSEKGIIAAVTPMDKYLADLNSGQNYYRPSYMLVATLNDNHPVNLIQQSMNQIMQHFYRHSFQYQHANMNCSGISLDALKALGWHVPERGKKGIMFAVAAYFSRLISDSDLTNARQTYDYLMTETSRLLPAVAFDAISNDLIELAENRSKRPLTDFEEYLSKTLNTLWLVRIPQIPSSRVSGNAPVFSFNEYLEAVPANYDEWISIDLPPQNFPESLKTATPVNRSHVLIPWPVTVIFASVVLMIISLLRLFLQSKRLTKN